MQAIIYCRVSTEKDTQESSLQRQEEELIYLANQHNFQVVKIVKEQASGYDLDRPGILEVMEHLENMDDRILLIQDETRLGRGNAKIALLHVLIKLGVKIYTISDNGELQISDADSMVLKIVALVRRISKKIT